MCAYASPYIAIIYIRSIFRVKVLAILGFTKVPTRGYGRNTIGHGRNATGYGRNTTGAYLRGMRKK